MRGIPASDPAPGVPSARLAPYGAHESDSLGRIHGEAPASHRGEYRRDRERIIHSTAFRRLEYKTQLFVNHEGDLYRTRLTHSIEVAQVARSAAYRLGLNEPLCEAIALAHDLGHTPFGHAGQDALNRCMQLHGGFEHNLQSLRVVDRLELKYPQFPGLNLTFETCEGILKHCSKKNARTLGPVAQRFLQRTQPGLEAQLANIADEIAYTSHDIDDGLRADLITVPRLREVELFGQHFDAVEREFPQLRARRKTYETIRRIRKRLAADLIEASQAAIDDASVDSIDAVRAHPEPLVRFSESMREKNQALKNFLREHLYRHERVHRMNREDAKVVADLYGAFFGTDHRMPDEYQGMAREAAERDGDSGRARVVSDYIAGMTDRYAISEHRRIFNEKIF